MEFQSENIIPLLSKIVNHEKLTSDEKIMLHQVFGSENGKELFFNQVLHCWTECQDSVDFDAKQLFKKIEREIATSQQQWVAKKILRPAFLKIAAVILLLIMGSYAGYFYSNYKAQLIINNILTINPQVVAQTYYAPLGLRTKIVLPDSSSVWLNGGSKLFVASTFNNGITRDVSLVGQAYFDVKSNKNYPFVVTVGDLKVKAVGTEFSIKAYQNDETIETVLVKGAVVLEKIGIEHPMAECQRAVLQRTSGISLQSSVGIAADTAIRTENKIKLQRVDVEKYERWKDGILIFEDTPMSEVIREVERWFNVKVMVDSDDIYQFKFTARLNNVSLSQILQYIALTSPISYHIDKKETTVILKKEKYIKM